MYGDIYCTVFITQRSRGGWPRAALHHGLIFHYASVYTISLAVWTCEQATEVPLKSEFLSPFWCKCWTLNVILHHNSSDYLTNTGWSMKTFKTWIFLRSSPRVISIRAVAIDQSHTCRWMFPFILQCFNVYRYVNDCASWEMVKQRINSEV